MLDDRRRRGRLGRRRRLRRMPCGRRHGLLRLRSMPCGRRRGLLRRGLGHWRLGRRIGVRIRIGVAWIIGPNECSIPSRRAGWINYRGARCRHAPRKFAAVPVQATNVPARRPTDCAKTAGRTAPVRIWARRWLISSRAEVHIFSPRHGLRKHDCADNCEPKDKAVPSEPHQGLDPSRPMFGSWS